ncbi:MAG: GTPase domain-containing protein [Vicinamibacteria bacterium]|jgi:hypothetical protein|nr:GTPase domain-containing protein [Vicinamibacteria bacterium]
MVQFNFSERTIKAKVVYYGPAQSGKTTNLEQIHRLTDPAAANSLISLNTGQDRTLFFDLLPFSLGTVSGYDFKVQLYTVPGQVQYNATRRVVLAGADAVVFVADSRKSMAKDNQTAFENMKVNLLANRLVPEKVPLVLQYNKRDLPDLQSEAEMTKALNPWGRVAVGAVAATGQGVMETFTAIVKEMLGAIAVKYNLKEKGLDPASVPALVEEAFAVLARGAAAAGIPPAGSSVSVPGGDDQAAASAAPQVQTPPKITLVQQASTSQVSTLQASPETGLVSEELLQRAIKSNVDLAETLSDVVRDMNQGLGTILSHSELLQVYKEDAREKRQAAIMAIHQEAHRLRGLIQKLGGVAPGQTSAITRSGIGTQSRAGAAAPRAAAAAAPAAAPAGFEAIVRDGIAGVQAALQSKGVLVDNRVAPGLGLPRCPAQNAARAIGLLLQAAGDRSAGTTFVARAERKPVLLRGRDGSEVRREFLMFAAAHGPVVPAEEQQQIVAGTSPGTYGDACRLVRELGGFVRFAPLPTGGLESRLFFPA